MADALFDADQICAGTFIRHVEIHETLGSTNDRAAELARDANIELPALVVAQHQTAGRGRGQNTWWSADGALTFSVLLVPAALGIKTANWPQLSLTTAVAICDALRREAPQAILGIKWPNDVMLDGRKVCGILIESPGGGAPAKDRLIIGIGINVNNSWRFAPREVRPTGTAMCDVTGRRHNLQSTLAAVIVALADRTNQLRDSNPILIRAWHQLNIIAGQYVIAEGNGRRVEGQCIEVAHDGALVIDTAFGRQRLFSGSIRTA